MTQEIAEDWFFSPFGSPEGTMAYLKEKGVGWG